MQWRFQILVACLDNKVTDAEVILRSLISINVKDKSCDLFKMYIFLVLTENWLLSNPMLEDKSVISEMWGVYLHNCSCQITSTDLRSYASKVRSKAVSSSRHQQQMIAFKGFLYIWFNSQIIEFTGIELQKMRINLQKMQLQNWNLAQSNSHILAEINLCKEKGKAKTNSQKNCSQEGEEAVDELTSNDNSKLCKGQRRRPTRSQSMGPSTTSKQVAEKETSESKRFRYQQHEPNEDLFEIEDEISTCSDSIWFTYQKRRNDENCAPAGSGRRESQRTSLGRPMRRAVQKVQSYKETPLNIKMRRSG
ncbi:Shugoshin-1 [Camellia lanceoleosa]|uniref:Shugoshin-1 n=1 Tax=Camellia lanceoleosa TaxID=1840588 RepID=A0ACC0FYU4_9ERIC|nr:Shugoshin-1 [Camellia lanceoleosa]